MKKGSQFVVLIVKNLTHAKKRATNTIAERMKKMSLRTDNEITIELERYEELIRKEMVFEMLKKQHERSTYKTETDNMLFDPELIERF